MNFFAKVFKLIEDKYTQAEKAFDESLRLDPNNDHAKIGFIGMVLRITNFIENYSSKKKFFHFIERIKDLSEEFPDFIFSFAEKAWSYKETITKFEGFNDKAKKLIVDLDKLFLFKDLKEIQSLIKLLSSDEKIPTNSSIVVDIYICTAIKESFGSWKKLSGDSKNYFDKISKIIENHVKNLENDQQSKVYFELNKSYITKLYRLWIETCRHHGKCPKFDESFERCKMYWCQRTNDIFSWYYILVTGYMAVLCGGDVNDYFNDIRQAMNILKDSPKFTSMHLEYYNVFNPESADMSGLKNVSELAYIFGDPKFYEQFHKFGGVNEKQMIVKTKEKKFSEALFNGLTFWPQSTGEETAKIDNELMNNSTISAYIGFSISKGAKVYKIEKL
jgi:tetratricopeptide (TPR) repeat protein